MSHGWRARARALAGTWTDTSSDERLVEYSFYLPVPEKTQLQHNYILMPKGSALLGLSKNAPSGVAEPLVFTVSKGAPKPGTIGGSASAAAENFSDSYSTLFHWSLSANLPASARITAANPDKFHSVMRQPHRPKEKAVHVKAFRGSKEGYLFFLENGLLWGFKKPLLFIPLSQTTAVSYCNVLRSTFNMVVEVMATGEDGHEKTEEVEFGMIDQADYAGIDEKYVRKNRLQDRSMAEQRKAKREMLANDKGSKKEKEQDELELEAESEEHGNGHALANGPTSLAHAQWEEEQRLQDEEDEDEEDYDPGSDDDSDGSGCTSEEEEEEEEEEED